MRAWFGTLLGQSMATRRKKRAVSTRRWDGKLWCVAIGDQGLLSTSYKSQSVTTTMSEAKPPSSEELASKASALKKSGDTKEAETLAVDSAAVETLSKLFTDNGGTFKKGKSAKAMSAKWIERRYVGMNPAPLLPVPGSTS